MSSDQSTQVNANAEQVTPQENEQSSAPAPPAVPVAAPGPSVSFKYWNPPRTGATAPRAQDLPDSFFEPSVLELKAAFASQQKLREELNNAPLKSKAIREKEENAKLSKWPTCTIRVKFPDLSQLETTFPSTDKIKSVYAFVRNSLREDVKPIKFILYQAPPRREYKVSDPEVKNLSLAQLSLAPSSVLMLTFLDESLNDPILKAPLTEEILAKAQDLPVPVPLDAPKNTGSGSKAKSFGAQKLDAAKAGLPKWLKLSKK